MATTSKVDTLIDDASLGRINTVEHVMHIQQLGVQCIRMGRRLLAEARQADAGLTEIEGALHELRQLHPTVRGRRTDLAAQVAAA